MEILTVIPIAAVSFVIICFLVLQYRAKKEKKSFNPGKVIIHQFSPSDLAPSGSPPCFKLETFLRMIKIPYENSYGMKFSKKGKMPWIEFNGLAIADSNFCIRFLMKEFHVDVDSHLSAKERATGHSIRTMLEESTYWWVSLTSSSGFVCWCCCFLNNLKDFMCCRALYNDLQRLHSYVQLDTLIDSELKIKMLMSFQVHKRVTCHTKYLFLQKMCHKIPLNKGGSLSFLNISLHALALLWICN